MAWPWAAGVAKRAALANEEAFWLRVGRIVDGEYSLAGGVSVVAFGAQGQRVRIPSEVQEMSLHGELAQAVAFLTGRGAAPAEGAFAALDRALALIGRLDPRRLRRLQRDLARVVVSSRPTGFTLLTGTCYLARDLVAGSEASVALALVHEGVHARFAGAGIISRGTGAAREEARCARE